MRLATFNVENLFERPRAMNLPRWSDGQPALAAANELNALFQKPTYSTADKARMLRLLGTWGLDAAQPRNAFLALRRIRGELVRRIGGKASIAANGRGDWVGWIELEKEAIDDEAIRNTARVIAEVNADVLVLVEVEHRPALRRFQDQLVAPLLAARGAAPYPFAMVIDGNDPRGIDVGVLSRFPIERMRSHVDDRDVKGRVIFSRDCPEYVVHLPGGRELVVLANHFASKGSDRDGTRRRVQAARVAELCREARQTHELVVVAGDLNDHPRGGSLDALLDGTDLVDAMALPQYSGLPGTYQTAAASMKLDYLLLSPALRRRVSAVGVCREGFFAPGKWRAFGTLTAATRGRFQASDHHCVWVDL